MVMNRFLMLINKSESP